MNRPKIAILISGKGSNAEKIISYTEKYHTYSVECLYSTVPNSAVFPFAEKHNVAYTYFPWKNNLQLLMHTLRSKQVNFIVLAGFLKKIPELLIKDYPNKIINIHPALLPNYGGKGMYGMHVHRAVLNNKEKQSGITVHYVNKYYDKGNTIFQKAIDISSIDTAEGVQKAVQKLEHKYYPKIVDYVVNGKALNRKI